MNKRSSSIACAFFLNLSPGKRKEIPILLNGALFSSLIHLSAPLPLFLNNFYFQVVNKKLCFLHGDAAAQITDFGCKIEYFNALEQSSTRFFPFSIHIFSEFVPPTP